MKNNWQTKKLSEVCSVFDDGDWIESKDQSLSGIRLIQTGNVGEGTFKSRGEKARYISESTFKRLNCNEIYEGDVLVSRLPDPVGRACIIPKVGERMITAVDCTILRFKPNEILPTYFVYYSQSKKYFNDVDKETGGTTRKRISKKKLGEIEMPCPNIEAQKIIVKKLDAIFENINKAKENTEKNLQNSRELFDVFLENIFYKPQIHWTRSRLIESFKLKSGTNITSKMMNKDDKYPVYGGNGVAGMYDNYNLSGNNVIIGRVGALCGNVRHITDKIWLTDNGFKITDFKYDFNFAFLTYLLNYKNLRKFARQAAQPVISNSSLSDVVLEFPKSLIEQKQIVKKLDSLSEQTKKLEENYRQKLVLLDELKKSVLQKAFSGEL